MILTFYSLWEIWDFMLVQLVGLSIFYLAIITGEEIPHSLFFNLFFYSMVMLEARTKIYLSPCLEVPDDRLSLAFDHDNNT